jgi:hypothetical protein
MLDLPRSVGAGPFHQIPLKRDLLVGWVVALVIEGKANS